MVRPGVSWVTSEGDTMTETLDAPATTTHTPSDTATAWLTAFEAALSARDVAAASALFATESWWRDLIAFSWNITTVEGRDGVRDLLGSTLETTDPSSFALDEPADEADGVISAWFVFETGHRTRARPAAAGRGGRGAPGLHVPHHALRAQGPRGAPQRAPAARRRARRRQAAPDVARATAGGGREPRQHHPALRPGDRRRPGRDRPRRAAAPARRAEPGDRQAPAARRPVAQPLQVAVPPRPGLVRPPALPEVPGQLAGLRAQGQDRRLARVLHEDHGGALLVEHDRDLSGVLARRRASGPSRWSARGSP